MRRITICTTTGKITISMNEEEYKIKNVSAVFGKPYFKANGVKYKLTEEEINCLKHLRRMVNTAYGKFIC